MASAGYSPNVSDIDASDFKFGIVVAEWNEDITDALLKGAKDTLTKNGAILEDNDVIKVPGSFELPIGAKILASSKKYDAIICLGCIIKGETDHDRFIAQSVANGLTQLSLLSSIPCLFGVLTTNDKQQATDRAGGKHGNKGSEAALGAIQMAQLKKVKVQPEKTIGFN